MTSRFTNKGLQLLAQYEASPATKQPFSKLAIGTLTDAQAAAADLYDGTETELHGESVQIWDGVATTVDPNDPTGRTARVKATIIPNAEVKGETIREVGLYITDGGTDWLAWIGKFPATYIPAADEPDMATNLVVTIPIQFNSAESVAVSTNSANFATQDDMDELAGELDTYIEAEKIKRIFADTSAQQTETIRISDYDRFKIFSFNHSNGTLTATGYDDASEIAAAIANDPTVETMSVTGYKVKYSSGNFSFSLLPSNFAKAELSIAAEDASNRVNVSKFIFTNYAATAVSTLKALAADTAAEKITTLFVGTKAIGQAMEQSTVWIKPATKMGSNRIKIEGSVTTF